MLDLVINETNFDLYESLDRAFADVKFHSLDDDYEVLILKLLKNPKMGNDLGNNTRKVHLRANHQIPKSQKWIVATKTIPI